MNANENKQMDNLIRKVIEKVPLEEPSSNFTAQIMAQLENTQQSETTMYRPLISKAAWFTIFGAVAALIIYTLNDLQPAAAGSYRDVDFSFLVSKKVVNTFSQLTFSNTLLYAFLSFSIMLLIQVSVLKSYFDKRF